MDWVNTTPTLSSNKYIYRGAEQTTGWTKYISTNNSANARSQINIYWGDNYDFKIKDLLDPNVIDGDKYDDILVYRSVSGWSISEDSIVENGGGYFMEMDNGPGATVDQMEVNPVDDRIDNLFVYEEPEVVIDDEDEDSDDDVEMGIIRATDTYNVRLYGDKIPKFLVKNDKAGPIQYRIQSENLNIHIKFRKTIIDNTGIHFDAVDTLTEVANLKKIYIHLYFENENGESYLIPPLPPDIIPEPGRSPILDPDLIPDVYTDIITLPEWLWDDIVIISDTTTISEEIDIYTYDGNGDYIGHDSIDCKITIN